MPVYRAGLTDKDREKIKRTAVAIRICALSLPGLLIIQALQYFDVGV